MINKLIQLIFKIPMVSILSKIDVNKINRGNGMVPQAGKKTITKKKETVRLPQKRWHNWFPFVFLSAIAAFFCRLLPPKLFRLMRNLRHKVF